MTVNELRHTLSTEDLIEINPFSILHEISNYVSNFDDIETGRELVLRALEKRQCFNGLDEILNSLTRQVGLFPYIEPDDLSLKDILAYEFHRPPMMEDTFVFHQAQAEVFRYLIEGENVILSAPTSFGKSKIIDVLIASGKYNNICVVVPTIALIDETRRRLSAFSSNYKVVTHLAQLPEERNIFVLTPERVNAYGYFPSIDFFVIDEFYKIGAISEDETRTIALNQAFYNLFKGGGQFYLLGPNISQIPDGLEEKFHCRFISTRFNTVVSELIPVSEGQNEIDRLCTLAEDLQDPTLIYCRSPKRVNQVARALVERKVCGQGFDFNEAASWISSNFHPDWIFQEALNSGIGMHHGKLPRSLAQFAVRAFNDGHLKFLVCTSTLIEGVNTKAKNVIILDNVIGRKSYDFFTFNNIRGRSGRMFHHFVGKVFLFHEPPQKQLPVVDFPFFTQTDAAPDSLLIQLKVEDLKPAAKERLLGIFEQEGLSIEVIRNNSGIDPSAQVALAKHIESLGVEDCALLNWNQYPTWEELVYACELMWNFLTSGRRRAGVSSARQLAFKVSALIRNTETRSRINEELRPGTYKAETADEAVERVLEFDRNWASFELPRLMMALSRIQEEVLQRLGRSAGDYSFFTAGIETLFRNPVAIAFEEYGLPIQIMDKILKQVEISEELDNAITEIKELEVDGISLDEFEKDLLLDVKAHL